MTRLVNALKSEHYQYRKMAYYVIDTIVAPGSEERFYLLEDALDLWHSCIINTPTGEQPRELIVVTKHLIPLLELGSDSLWKVMQIIESYLMLLPNTILAGDFRITLILSLTKLIHGGLNREAAAVALSLIQLMIRKANDLAGDMGVAEVVKEMLLRPTTASEGWPPTNPNNDNNDQPPSLFMLLTVSEKGLRYSTNEANPDKATGPQGLLESDYFAVLSRIAISEPRTLVFALGEVDRPGWVDPRVYCHKQLDWLLREWFSHLDNVSAAPSKKLMLLAITRLLEVQMDDCAEYDGEGNKVKGWHGEFMMPFLQDLFTQWTSLIIELTEGNIPGDKVDCLVDRPGSLTPTASSSDTPEDRRRVDLRYADPVHKVDMKPFVDDRLRGVIERMPGGEREFNEEWLANVDKDVVQAFVDLGKETQE